MRLLITNNIAANPTSFGNLLLKDFHEITLPETVSYLPVTVGWQLLALVAVACGLFHLYRKLCLWRKNRYRRHAVAALAQIMQHNLPAAQTIQQLAALLKATALQAYPRHCIASLSGADWLAFLQQQTVTNLFDQSSEALLITGQYRADLNDLSPQVCRRFAHQIEQWLWQHRPSVVGIHHA